MDNLPFTFLDSFAFWNKPQEDIEQCTDAEREKLFGQAYRPKFFPKDQLPHNLSEYIQQLKYVLVGMNPGNAIAEHPQEPFLNFHGSKNSADYRLAAAVYGTKLWGSLMTDLSQQIQSDSTKVRIDANDVQALEHHLDALGVAQDAVLVALGQTTFNNLNKFAQRKVLYIPHYSNSNNGSGDNRWDAKRVHSRILTMTK